MIQYIGNPFSEISTDQYTLHTKVIKGGCVVKTIGTAEDVGIAQYQRLILLMNVLVIKQQTSITPFEKNNSQLLTPAPVRQLIDRHLGWPKLMCNSSKDVVGPTFHAYQGRVIWIVFLCTKTTHGPFH